MKISYKALQSLIEINHEPEELGKILTSTGLEVEAIEKIDAVKGGLEGLVIGKVVHCEKHPDADKLSITKVDIGEPELLDIVCGAPNVSQGIKVIVATVGTMLYPTEGEPFQIKKSKIRGAVSNGMLCAEDEIGLGKSHDGLLILDTDLPIGTPVSKYFNLEPDYLIEIGLTPNRADAASHYGVARDIKAITQKPIVLPSIDSFKLGTQNGTIDLLVEDTEKCPRFCGLEIRGITVKESPQWLKAFLNTIGVSSINNIVDITNYICHYLGQPMHIFDADAIGGAKIIVRTPKVGVKITTLDTKERTFKGTELAICDANGPMAIAGVFGGLNSGVKDNTTNIFLEVAYFDAAAIRKSSNTHGLKTDASFRYERGTDPNMPPYAIRLAAILIQDLAGGEIAGNIFDNYPTVFENKVVSLKYKNVDRLIGKILDRTEIQEILKRLDFELISSTEENITVSVPAYRVDVYREADIIEEILRIYGFDNVELSEHLSSDFFASFPEKEAELSVFDLGAKLAAMGFNEIQTLSIVNHKANIRFNDEALTVKLLNPLSEDQSEMRRSLLFSGLEAINYNINRRAKNLKFFEFGRYYEMHEQEGVQKPKEFKILSLFVTGNTAQESWQKTNIKSNFFFINQKVKEVLMLLKIDKYEVEESKANSLAYGLSYKLNGKVLVNVGKVSAENIKAADLKQEIFWAEINWDLAFKSYRTNHVFSEIPKFPDVRRDLSIVVPKTISFKEIETLARQNEKKLLQSINVFDIYEGDKLPAGTKSYSVSFMLIDTEKTLTDKVIDQTMNKLILAFENNLEAIIRK